MDTGEAMIDRTLLERFAAEIVSCLVRYAGLTPAEAKHLYQESFVARDLEGSPEPFLHETAYYWAMFLVTGDPYAEQYPASEDPDQPGERLPAPITAVLRTIYEEGAALLSGDRKSPGSNRPAAMPTADMEQFVFESDLQLPEAPSGHLEARPAVAFLTLAPLLRPEEDCPRLGTPFSNWLAYYRDRFDELRKGSVYWWRRNGEPGGADRLYNAYRHLLALALGPQARLGWDAVVAHALPYKVPHRFPHAILSKAAHTYSPDTLIILLEAGVKVVVTIGFDAANEFAYLLGEPRSERKTREVTGPYQAFYEGHSFLWVPAAYPFRTSKQEQVLIAGAIREAL